MATQCPDVPLLFFDSGIGGLSVLSAVRRELPAAPIVYAADYAGLPYGTKSEMEVATRVCALLGRLSERFAPRLAVIACNTASTIALAHVRAVLGIPIVGTVPAIKPASEQSKTGVIGLLGTAATIRQKYVDQLEAEFASDKILLRFAAPELVAAAESKMRGEPIEADIFVRAMRGLKSQPNGEKIDAVVLGCTHFPLVEAELRHAAVVELGMSPEIGFIDGSAGIARRIKYLTADQSWQRAKSGDVFVTTGELSSLSLYENSLRNEGFDNFVSL